MHLEQTYQKLHGTWDPNNYVEEMRMNGMGFASNAGVPFTPEAGAFNALGNTRMSNESKLDGNYNSNRMSGSSFTMSTTGPQSDTGYCDDYSGSVSGVQSMFSDHPQQSNRTSLLSSIHSPITSPQINTGNTSGVHRMGSRGKASPSSKIGRASCRERVF